MTRRKILAGNWKMHKTVEESEALAREIAAALKDKPSAHEVVVCPTYVALDRVAAALAGTSVAIGAQDMHWEAQGAFTGKISGDMLKALGVTYVILGHSEQRAYFHETDETVNKKVRKALADGLRPIVCVGETLEEREGSITENVVETQMRGAYAGLTAADALNTVVAYEPVWAIGTGRTATSRQAQDVHKFIRGLLASLFDAATADAVRIQYGGSMKPENAAELLSQPDVDGGLIGGAALKADAFLGIIHAL
jgi:triosephosphate isomerase (TIM)